MSQLVPVPLIGPSSKARSAKQQSGRTVNLYPEVNDPDSKAVVALHACPGQLRMLDMRDVLDGDVEIRGFCLVGSRFFFVADNKICEAIYLALDGNPAGIFQWGDLQTASGRVGMSANNGNVIIGDGTAFYVLGPLTGGVQIVEDEDGNPIRGWFSEFLDGYTIYLERDSGRYHYSNIGDPLVVEGLNFVTAEGDPDNAEAMVVSNRELVIGGRKSTEYHANYGDEDNAIQRIPGGFIEVGVSARWSMAEYDNAVVAVGSSKDGHGIVWRFGSAGSAPVRMSTHAVEYDLSQALAAGLSEQITAYTYQDEGESFYVLNIPATPAQVNSPVRPSKTWAFGAASGMWHERAHKNPVTGLFERAKADFHVLYDNKHLVGSYDEAIISWQNRDFFRDVPLAGEALGCELVKFRESAHLSFQGRTFSVHKLWIDMEVGVGRDGGVQGSDPQLMLQVSWDGGKTFGNEVWRTIGKIGEYSTRVEFHRLGMGTDFVIRVSVSDPVRVVFVGATADVTVGR